MNLKKVILKFTPLFNLLLCISLMLLFSCNPRFESQIYTDKLVVFSSQYSSLGYETYKAGFYAFTQKQGCAKCHSNKVSPNFASANPDRAYESALGNKPGSNTKLIDFTDTTNSLFIENAGNGHCNEAPCSDPSVRAEVQKYLDEWAKSELIAGSADTVRRDIASVPMTAKYLTASLKVPATIPTIFNTAAGVIRFNLSQLKPVYVGLENAVLEIEIQTLNDNVYRLNKPKIIGNTNDILVSDLSVFIKTSDTTLGPGSEDVTFTTNWHSVIKPVTKSTLPATLPTGPLTLTPLIDLPIYYRTENKDDFFTIGIGEIRQP